MLFVVMGAKAEPLSTKTTATYTWDYGCYYYNYGSLAERKFSHFGEDFTYTITGEGPNHETLWTDLGPGDKYLNFLPTAEHNSNNYVITYTVTYANSDVRLWKTYIRIINLIDLEIMWDNKSDECQDEFAIFEPIETQVKEAVAAEYAAYMIRRSDQAGSEESETLIWEHESRGEDLETACHTIHNHRAQFREYEKARDQAIKDGNTGLATSLFNLMVATHNILLVLEAEYREMEAEYDAQLAELEAFIRADLLANDSDYAEYAANFEALRVEGEECEKEMNRLFYLCVEFGLMEAPEEPDVIPVC